MVLIILNTNSQGRKENMKRNIDFCETVTYNHSIKVEAESEDMLNEIEDTIDTMIENGEVNNKKDLFKVIKAIGGDYELMEDDSPTVDYE